MSRSRRNVGQLVLGVISLLVVLSMVLGLAISVMPQPSFQAESVSSRPFLFAVSGENSSNPSAYTRLLEAVLEDGNLFLVHTGNLTASGDGPGFQEFASLMDGFPLPFYPVPGNHDIHQGTLDNFLQYSGAPGPHYSFDYELVHFTVVNSDQGNMASEELAWLRADLLASEQPLKMVFLHYPPFDVAGGAGSLQSDGESFTDLMEELGVDYVFAGHLQGYHAEERDGVRYIITGGPDTPVGQGSEDGGFHHYVIVAVRGTEVIVEAVPIE